VAFSQKLLHFKELLPIHWGVGISIPKKIVKNNDLICTLYGDINVKKYGFSYFNKIWHFPDKIYIIYPYKKRVNNTKLEGAKTRNIGNRKQEIGAKTRNIGNRKQEIGAKTRNIGNRKQEIRAKTRNRKGRKQEIGEVKTRNS
jgi:hypothetical protein